MGNNRRICAQGNRRILLLLRTIVLFSGRLTWFQRPQRDLSDYGYAEIKGSVEKKE